MDDDVRVEDAIRWFVEHLGARVAFTITNNVAQRDDNPKDDQ